MSKSSRRCGLAVALLGFWVAALAPAPVGAQENPRFFGVWQPASTSAGGFPLTFEPGRVTFWDGNELDWERHYEVIKDFGDRVVVKIWTVKVKFEYPLNKPELMVFSVRRMALHDGSSSLVLSYDFCASDQAEAYFFKTDDKAEIWQRILIWSTRRDQGFPYDDCGLNDDGSFPYMWSGAGFTRPAPLNK